MTEQSGRASRFSAPGPALGYLAQVDYALWVMLERMNEEESFSVSIETLDDIVFGRPGRRYGHRLKTGVAVSATRGDPSRPGRAPFASS